MKNRTYTRNLVAKVARNHQRVLSALLTVIALATASMMAGCGGGSDSSSPPTTAITVPTKATIVYRQGDLSATDARLQKMTASLGTTSGALLQAIFAVNSFVFTDPKVTDYATYRQRQADANQALGVLILYAGQTEQNANALTTSATSLAALKFPQGVTTFAMAAASPEEVLAVLNSSKSAWPIKTLMQQYQVSAKKAQLILNNAMAGLTSQAYLDQTMVETQAITRLTLVKEAAGLAVTVGGTVVTAGAAGGVLTAFEAGSAVVSSVDAVIKVTKAGAELVIGQDGALDSIAEKSSVIRTIADVSEMVTFKGLFTKSSNFLDTANKLTWVGGKLSEAFQDKKVSFGAESINLADLNPDFKAIYLERVKALKYPTTFPGKYIDAAKQPVAVSTTDMPQLVLDALEALPVADQLAIVQQILPDSVDVPIIGNGITLAATKVSSDDTSITYTVSAKIQGVTGPTSVVMTVANAVVVNASRTLTANGVLTWSVTVLGQNGTVTVTRGDNGGSLSTTLPGQVQYFDGNYTGFAVTTFQTEFLKCFGPVGVKINVNVNISGSVLSGDVVGTVSGNVVSGKAWADHPFSGVISGATMSGTWYYDSDDANFVGQRCSGTLSVTRQ